MKNLQFIFILLILLILDASDLLAQVGINQDSSDPHASAMLDIKSNSKGLLIPRLTTVERTGILSPANGLMAYDTDTNSFWYYSGTVWQEITLNTDDQTLTLTGTFLSIEDGNAIDLATIDTDTDDQTLTLTGTSLSIADGNSVDLASIDTDTDTDDQTLTLTGTSLSIADGNSVDLASIDTDTDTDEQTLTLTGTTLSIADGNSVDLGTLPVDNDWTTTGSHISNGNGGNVGINTTAPASKLHIKNGNLQVSSDVDAPSIKLVDDSDASSWTIRHQRSKDHFEILNSGNPNSIVKIQGNNGHVGIGLGAAEFASSDLHVKGNVKIQDGTQQNNYVFTSNANGVGSWKDPNSLVLDTDDQTLSLSGTDLTISEGNTVDLASIDTDTDTDDQTLTLTGTSLSIADGNAVDLAAIDTDTDDQTLTLTGTSLSIADGNSVDLASIDTDTDTDDQTLSLTGTDLTISEGNTVDLSSIDTDTDTDDQIIDVLSLTGTTLEISLADDGEATKTLDLASIDTDTDTDDQTIDVLSLTGTTLEISLADDGEATKTLDLASIDTDTDDQTLTLTGTSLSIADGNAVDLAAIDTDTDDQTLTLTGTSLSIADGNAVDLASIDTDTDTDDQTLSLSGSTLSIADGNSVDLGTLPSDADWTITGNNIYSTNSGNVGIGTTSPDATAKMHVDLASSTTDGVLVSGTYNAASTIPNLGGGSRMMFYPGKGAFRAGRVTGSKWDDANVGLLSTALGQNTTASGQYSTAMGNSTTASGDYSTATGFQTTASGTVSTAMGSTTTASGNFSTVMGKKTTASGAASTAMGASTTASGNRSTAMGSQTTASGQNSTAMGDRTTASGSNSTAMGIGINAQGNYSVAIGLNDQTGTIVTDANVMSIMGGKVGIGTVSPAESLEVNGQIRMTDGNQQAGYILASDVNGTGTWTDPATVFTDTDDQALTLTGTSLSIEDGNAVDLASIDTDTDDQTLSLSGSTLSIADGNSVDLGTLPSDSDWTITGNNIYSTNSGNVGIGTSTPDATAKLHVDLGSSTTNGFLISGIFNGASTVPNLGAGSRTMYFPGTSAFRTGRVTGTQWDNVNVGKTSTAMGYNTIAKGSNSVALGNGAQALNNNSVSIGQGAKASNLGAVAIGYQNKASGVYSLAMGHKSTSSGHYSVSIGDGTNATGESAIALGKSTIASGSASISMGYLTQAQGHYSTSMGNSTKAVGFGSVAMGNSTLALNQYSLALGDNNEAQGDYSIVGGKSSVSKGSYSVALGRFCFARNQYSFALGQEADVQGDYSFGIGLDPTQPFTIYQNKTMAIMGGKVGIGTASPQEALHIVGNLEIDQQIKANDNTGLKLATDEGTTRLSIKDNGNVIVNDWISGDGSDKGLQVRSNNKILISMNGTVGASDNPETYIAHMKNTTAPFPSSNHLGILALTFDAAVPGKRANWIQFFENITGKAGAIEGNDSGNAKYTTGGSDYAEELDRLFPEEVIKAGQIVGVFGGKISKKTKGADWVMAISDNPAVVGNMSKDDETETLREIVGFVGQVRVYVKGKVQKGDYIVASGQEDGVAIAISSQKITPDQSGLILGRAWENKDNDRIERVNTVVGLPDAVSLETALFKLIQSQQTELGNLKANNESYADRLERIEAHLNLTNSDTAQIAIK